ncbi:MAG: replication initiation protein [Deltaproteobacteria bacterium]|nr:MAG: replication initiation protein [Deltaproteobacteria bacterium]
MNKIIPFTIILIFIVSPGRFGETRPESTCYGTTVKGRLENGVKLPPKGKNFQTYSLILSGVGRTYIHNKVHKVVLNAYKSLEKTHSDKIFVYGETGWKTGGRFKPHKTHQNGLSVDFMTPVVDEKGVSVPLPTGIFNKYGYGIEFDKQGHFENLSIDFDAMAAHIKSLHIEAKKAGIDIWRVIFDPGLQPFLYRTKEGKYLRDNIRISDKKSWVRHDEHYHVDFKVKCKKL